MELAVAGEAQEAVGKDVAVQKGIELVGDKLW